VESCVNRVGVDLNTASWALLRYVAGINERGCYNSNLLLVETERAMMTSAEEVIVVADSTKFGHTSLAHLCNLNDIDVLVTDHEIDSAWRERIHAAGVKLVVAENAGQATRVPE
jgi:DeoR/GlpR family transcriptional regulator of sugar metabolism